MSWSSIIMGFQVRGTMAHFLAPAPRAQHIVTHVSETSRCTGCTGAKLVWGASRMHRRMSSTDSSVKLKNDSTGTTTSFAVCDCGDFSCLPSCVCAIVFSSIVHRHVMFLLGSCPSQRTTLSFTCSEFGSNACIRLWHELRDVTRYTIDATRYRAQEVKEQWKHSVALDFAF